MSFDYDVIVVGGSFAGLSFAHHLPDKYSILLLDAKPTIGSSVESTGLITSKTRDEFQTFFEVDRFITNPITSICVVDPSYERYFVSKTTGAWIYQTDTRGLVAALADSLPAKAVVSSSTVFLGAEPIEGGWRIFYATNGVKGSSTARFLIGADGGRSRVAELTGLDRNKRFLFGFEQVIFGDVLLGPQPAETIYHFWFGDFSLGYGGWLSPTMLDGKPAFRIGLAKLVSDRQEAPKLLRLFLQALQEKRMIRLAAEHDQPAYQFGSMIPLGGVLRYVSREGVLLLGDAAGLCGAFAADGIKGAIVSGKEGARLVGETLRTGKMFRDIEYHKAIQQHDGLMSYYRRQVRYRWIWDRMKRNRTFAAMYDIIAAEKESFLDQFCDSKDKRTSLTWVVLKWRHVLKLIRYSWFVFLDMIF